MEYLLSAWSRIFDQIEKAKHILFLSDFDGTLAPIEERPELVAIPETTCKLLEALNQEGRFTVGIISGRALSDLKYRVNVDGIIYAGNHGCEIEGPGLSFINPLADEIKPLFRVLRQVLFLTLGTIKGILIEDKGLTLSVHYRQVADEKAHDIETLVERAVNGPASHGLFKVTSGKKVYEVRPVVNWDKGRAIRLLMKKYGKGGRQSGLLPIYLGDDRTDEDGFRMIEKYGDGISVHIGGIKAGSAARYYLNSPEEVSAFIDKLLKVSQTGLAWEQMLTS